MLQHPEKEAQIVAAIRMVQTIRINDYQFSQLETELLLEQIVSSGKRLRQRKRRRMISYSVAAGIAVVLSLTLWLSSYRPENFDIQQSTCLFPQSDEDIRLITANQEVFELDNNSDVVCLSGDVQIKNGQKHIHLDKPSQLLPGMNTLIVPYGKRTSLTFPDSTRIWLNAGSKVEFPTQFAAEKREIYVEGEVYLEVAKAAGHLFIVHTPFYSVRVLGTKFNVSAYKNDQVHSVVLAEGVVEVDVGNHSSYRLKPNHKLTLTDRQAEICEVDAYRYISWKDGILQFSQETLSMILERVSHYYGVDIKYYPTDNDRVSGKLVLFDDIRTVLDNIAVIIPITYSIENRQIQIIKKQ